MAESIDNGDADLNKKSGKQVMKHFRKAQKSIKTLKTHLAENEPDGEVFVTVKALLRDSRGERKELRDEIKDFKGVLAQNCVCK